MDINTKPDNILAAAYIRAHLGDRCAYRRASGQSDRASGVIRS